MDAIMTRHVNDAALALIQQWEGLRLDAYQDVAGVWTIGYGSTTDVHPGQRITQEQAVERLRRDLATAEQAVWSAVDVDLTDNQFGALVLFVFNVGAGAFRASTLLKKLNAGDYAAVPGELAKWNKARVNGVLTPVSGLSNRRAAEAGLWAKGEYVASASAPVAPAATAPSPANDTGIMAGVAGAAATAAPFISGLSGVHWAVGVAVVVGAVAIAALWLLRRQRAA